MRNSNQVLRQCAGVCVAVAEGKMPGVRRAHFGDVSASGIGHGTVVCGSVFRVRRYARNGEVAIFHVPDHRSDDYGFARAAAAGFDDLAGICGGAGVLNVCATE